MFLQVHSLVSYHATLLNRDESGLAKRVSFGNAVRLRVSSQCQKKHWRGSLTNEFGERMPDGWRTRELFPRIVVPALKQAGMDDVAARTLAEALAGSIMKLSEKGDKAEKRKGTDPLAMKQPVFFGKPEVDYLIRVATDSWKQCDKDAAKAAKVVEERLRSEKDNFRAMLKAGGCADAPSGLTGALFGRFITSDILARSDASVHVAHAMTVHAAQTEVDFFTAVDDLSETGAAHAGDAELGAGLYYAYVVADVPLLVSNLTGCDPKEWTAVDTKGARDVLRALVDAIAEVSPGAKKGSSAPYARSEFILLETGRRQPRSLSNAFLQAVPPKGDMMQASVDRLSAHLQSIDVMYGPLADTRYTATVKTCSGLNLVASVSGGIDNALNDVFGHASWTV